VPSCPDEYAAARRRLGRPDTGPGALTRRRFLQAGLVGAGAVLLESTWASRFAGLAEAATPLAPGQGVLVVILLGGGNDGFNMVVPASDSAYYAARNNVAVPASSVLPIDEGFGLHPSLPRLATRYHAGHVACVMGVGYPNPDLSHFTSMANWMSGVPGGSGAEMSGWLGRWLDTAGNPDGLTAVAIDDTVPLHMIGTTTAATALPTSLDSAFGAKAEDKSDPPMFAAVSQFGSGATGLGPWGDALARNGAATIQLGAQVSPLYSPALPTADLSTQLALAARLVNANLGIRVLAVEWNGDFDVHSDEVGRYPDLMKSLDDGIDTFYSTLAPSWSGAVTLMTFSEFGRRMKANDSGTDHGTASTMLVIGDQVKGGIAGAPPSLSKLDNTGNVVMTTDFRSVYATVLADWLQGDPEKVLGGAFPTLPLFSGTPSGGGTTTASSGGGGTGPVTVGSGPGYWMAAADGTVYGFGRSLAFPPGAMWPLAGMAGTPDKQGAWLVRVDGRVLNVGDAVHYGDLGGVHLAKPIVGMASTPSGKGYWLVASDGGIFTFGDATFAGSAGALPLANPIVGMASTPSGKGYWLVASDGGIFTYGDAPYQGSMGGSPPQLPVVSIVT